MRTYDNQNFDGQPDVDLSHVALGRFVDGLQAQLNAKLEVPTPAPGAKPGC